MPALFSTSETGVPWGRVVGRLFPFRRQAGSRDGFGPALLGAINHGASMRNSVIERRIQDSEAGVSFVEVLLAMLILLITSVSLMGIFTTAIALNHRNKI